MAVKTENPDSFLVEYTTTLIIRHLLLAEDHLLEYSRDPTAQCLACLYWHLEKLIAYTSLECVKFEGMDTPLCKRLSEWAADTQRAIDKMSKGKALEYAKEARKMRYDMVESEAKPSKVTLKAPEPTCRLAQEPKVKITGTCEDNSGQSIMFQERCAMEQEGCKITKSGKFALALISPEDLKKVKTALVNEDVERIETLLPEIAKKWSMRQRLGVYAGIIEATCTLKQKSTELHLDPLLAAIGCQIGIGSCFGESKPLGDPSSCKLVKDYVHCRYQDKGKFDPKSFRTKEITEGVKVTVGCPKGEYSPSTHRCKTGTEVQKVMYHKNVCSEHEGCKL